MSNKAKVECLGAKELEGRFRELNEIIRTSYVEQSIEQGAEVIYDSIERKAPRRTGTLSGDIQISTIENTRTRIVKGIFVGASGFYWRFLEFGTKRMQPHPFVKRAFTNRRSTAIQTIRDTFRDFLLGFLD